MKVSQILTATTLQVLVSIARDALRYVDEHARGDEFSLRIDLRAWTTVTRGGQAPISGQTFAQRDVLVSRAAWVKHVLGPIGVGDYVLMELPVPPPPERERWRKSLEHIAEAEGFYHEGRDAEVLHRCHAAFEALDGAPKAVFSIASLTRRSVRS